jgi:hypothetical protein
MAEATLCAGELARGLKGRLGNKGNGYLEGIDGVAYKDSSGGTDRGS